MTGRDRVVSAPDLRFECSPAWATPTSLAVFCHEMLPDPKFPPIRKSCHAASSLAQMPLAPQSKRSHCSSSRSTLTVSYQLPSHTRARSVTIIVTLPMTGDQFVFISGMAIDRHALVPLVKAARLTKPSPFSVPLRPAAHASLHSKRRRLRPTDRRTHRED